MGFYFRKSVRVGPFRVNVSKSGLGLSLGGGGFRLGSSPRRRRYTTFSLPGSGMGYRTSGRGCASGFLLGATTLGLAGLELSRRLLG